MIMGHQFMEYKIQLSKLHTEPIKASAVGDDIVQMPTDCTNVLEQKYCPDDIYYIASPPTS